MTPEQPEDPRVRRVLEGLPPVEPPPGFFPRLVHRARMRTRGLVASGVVATFVVLTLGVAVESGVDEQEVRPELGALVDQHRAVARNGTLVGGFEPTDQQDVPAPYWAPADLEGSFHAMGAFADHDLMQIAYSDGRVELSVFEQPGDLDTSVLRRQRLDRVDEGWMTEDGPVVAMVVERGDMVYMLVGDAEPTEMVTVVERLPESQSLGLADRVREAADDLMDLFALG